MKQEKEIDHVLGIDGLIDLGNYLLSLPENVRSLSGENESIIFEFGEYDGDELGELRIWDAEEISDGVRARFRSETGTMPVTEYENVLADEAKDMIVTWGDEGRAFLQLYNPIDGEYARIGSVTGVDFGDDPSEPPVVTLRVSGEWKRRD